jgi:hypothetical protein
MTMKKQRSYALVELELITESSAEDTFLRRGFMWSDFHSWADGKMVWIRPDVFFDLTPDINMEFQTEYRSFLAVYIQANEEEETSQETKSLYVHARSEVHATVASNILL